MDIKLRHIGVVVKDLTKMINFYSYFGFSEPKYKDEDADFYKTIYNTCNLGKFETYKLKMPDNTILELIEYIDNVIVQLKNKVYSELGLSHMSFTVEDIECVYNDLILQGIEFLSPPLIHPENIVKLCFCKDPEGNLIELVQEL